MDNLLIWQRCASDVTLTQIKYASNKVMVSVLSLWENTYSTKLMLALEWGLWVLSCVASTVLPSEDQRNNHSVPLLFQHTYDIRALHGRRLRGEKMGNYLFNYTWSSSRALICRPLSSSLGSSRGLIDLLKGTSMAVMRKREREICSFSSLRRFILLVQGKTITSFKRKLRRNYFSFVSLKRCNS